MASPLKPFRCTVIFVLLNPPYRAMHRYGNVNYEEMLMRQTIHTLAFITLQSHQGRVMVHSNFMQNNRQRKSEVK